MDAPKTEDKEDLKGLFDLAIPLGMPVSLIRELVENFELDLVKRKAKVDMVGFTDEREILVLRGDLETVMKAKKFMFDNLEDRLDNLGKNEERSARYKELYEARVKELRQERAKEKEKEEESYAQSRSDSAPGLL